MKNLIVFIIVIVVLAFAAQKYTDFKAVDLGMKYLAKIEQRLSSGGWEELKNWFQGFIKEKVKNYEGPSPEKNLNIFIRDGKFLPSKSAVLKDTKVTWYNEDTKSHTITGEGWGSPEMAPAATFSKTFSVPGDFEYHCSSYPSMTGEIIVQ